MCARVHASVLAFEGARVCKGLKARLVVEGYRSTLNSDAEGFSGQGQAARAGGKCKVRKAGVAGGVS